MADKQTNKERLKEITDGIEQGIQDLFESDRYRQYLSVMSRFHRYSVNNTMLIYMQKPDASLVAGFQKWKNQFGRHVKKGERGITIIAPTPFKKRIEEVKLDPDTNAPLLDKDGNQIVEEKEINIPMFKPVKVFDVSQTDGKPLPHLASTLTGSVEQYEIFMEALRRSASVPIKMEPIEPGTDGYFSLDDQSITIREGMSEVQTVSAVIHEIAHSKLHNTAAPIPEDAERYDVVELFDMEALFANGRIPLEDVPEGLFRYELRGSDDDPGDPATLENEVRINHAGTIITSKPISIPEVGYLDITGDNSLNFLGDEMSIQAYQQTHKKDRRTEEVEAESISYAVCQYFGIETGENSFGYIASWSKGKELKELRESLETINKTASGLITDIDHNFAEICKERGIDPKALTEQEQVEAEPEPEAPDAYQLYAADLCDYLDQLHRQGQIEAPFVSMTKEENAAALADMMRHGDFGSANHILTEAAEQSGILTPSELLKRLLALSDEWDKGLTYQVEKNILQEGNSYVLAFAGETSHGVIFSGPTEVCQKLLTELNEGTMTARQVRALGRQWEVNAIPAAPEPVADTPAQAPENPRARELIEHYAVEESAAALDTYPMPDESVSIGDLEAAGYMDGDMLPVTRDRAYEMLDQGLTVYGIVDGGKAEMCIDSADVDMISGDVPFAVLQSEWEASQAFDEQIQERLSHQEEREASFLDYPGDAYAIYQVKHTDDLRFIRYESMEELQSMGDVPRRENYDLIYTHAGLPEGYTQDAVLGNLWQDFNINRPVDYHSPSMSVSDIVALKQGGEVSYHYCDSEGFQKLPGFNQPENYLKAAEMAMEDDYGMIDGIINNGPKQPTVAELEAQVNAGQSISLLDLANAIQAEKKDQPRGRSSAPKAKEEKPSILDRLKQPAPEQTNKSAPHRRAEREI